MSVMVINFSILVFSV